MRAKRGRRAAWALALMACSPGLRSSAGQLDLQGAILARAVWTRGQPSWLEEGFGRLPEGASSPGGSRFAARGQAQLGLDWKPAERWLVHAHGVLQGEPSSHGGRRAGLVEGFVQFRPELGVLTSLRLRAGTLFPQTSLENVEPLWQSPYTLTLSALNTWTAEELRLTGLDATLVRQTERGDRLELAGAAFGAADSAGALLAWRGWSLGDRLTTVGELLPLPPLTTFAPDAGFADQRAGTRPVEELDGRIGWQSRARWTWPGGGRVLAAYLDNRGDRELHRGQYAWRTRFTTVGLELPLGGPARLLLEGAAGRTGMGPRDPDRAHVDLRFRTGYALLTLGRERWRVSLRAEHFRNRDLDRTAEPGQESGHAFTVAAFWQPTRTVRVGAEYLELRAQREAAAFSGADPDTDARRALLELRLRF